ncbi:right-handed parallel beta-helix repeat-containing protein [Chloroflexota bacterium]
MKSKNLISLLLHKYTVYLSKRRKSIHKGYIFLLVFVLILFSFSCNLLSALQESDEPERPPAVQVEAPPPVIPPSEIGEQECTYYVSPDGSDENDGSQDQPWGSFQEAADSVSPGDMVCFRGGDYAAEETLLTISGSPQGWITFAAYPGEIPVLDGRGEVGELLIFTQGVSYQRLSGFALRNFTDWGIEISGENHHLHLDHLDITGGEASVRFTYGDSEEEPREGPVEDVIVEDSIFRDSEYTSLDCTPGPCNRFVFRRLEVLGAGLIGEDSFGSDGIAVNRGSDILVEDCYVHDNGGDGIDLNSRDHQGNVSGIMVARNRVVRNHLNGIKVWAGGRIENNLVWGMGNSAFWVGTWDSTIEIVNNTIAYNMWERSFSGRNWVLAAGLPEDNPRPIVKLTLVNNILAFNADPLDGGSVGIFLGPGVQLTEGHNLYFSRADGEITAEYITGHDTDITRQEIADGVWASLSGGGIANLTIDPLFMAAWPDVDLHLLPNSPAIDAGDPLWAPADDIDQQPRDNLPDLGAYEFH